MVGVPRSMLHVVHFIVYLLALAEAAIPSNVVSESPLVKCTNATIRDTTGLTGRDIEESNQKIGGFIDGLAKSPYFSFYKVDLSDEMCPFQDDSGFCGNRACAIEPLDDDMSGQFGSSLLGRLRPDSVSHDVPQDSVEDCAPNEKSIFAHQSSNEAYNYCYPEDESTSDLAVWVDLNDNVERYTGYGGSHAHKVWRAVYQENCFGYQGDDSDDSAHSPGVWGRPSDAHDPMAHFSSDAQFQRDLSRAQVELAQVFSGNSRYDKHARQEVGGEAGRDALNRESHCVEERMFYKLLSGMHASISTHLSFDYLDPVTKQWGPNLTEFMSRVGDHPDRLNNLYFNYALVSRAISKLRDFVGLLAFSSTCPTIDKEVRVRLVHLASAIDQTPQGVDETAVFSSKRGKALKEEFRNRVRNVNGLMSCVGCERCQLWGKIQTAGYGAALKLLFELPVSQNIDPATTEEVLSNLHRSELVALIQTFARLSHSIKAVRYFRHELETTSINTKSLGYQWQLAWDEFKVAIKFVLRSYIDFPKNAWHLLMAYATIYWNKFIGRDMTYTLVDKYVHKPSAA